MLLNSELPLLLLLYYFVLVLALLILKLLCRKSEAFSLWVKQFWSLHFFWRVCQLCFFEFSFLSLLDLPHLSFSSAGAILSSLLLIAFILLCAGLTLIMAISLIARRNSISVNKGSKNFRIGYALNLEKRKCARLMVIPLFLLERLVYAVILSGLTSSPESSLFLLVSVSSLVRQSEFRFYSIS